MINKFREVLISTSKLMEITHFYYGTSNRLKGLLKYHKKEKCYELSLYKGRNQEYLHKLIFNNNKSKSELYNEAKTIVKKYEERCLY